LFGSEIEAGKLPADLPWTGKIIQDICYNNAADYFGWKEQELKSIPAELSKNS
jgi:glucuronate isomerase